jgi:hypothetical protein
MSEQGKRSGIIWLRAGIWEIREIMEWTSEKQMFPQSRR